MWSSNPSGWQLLLCPSLSWAQTERENLELSSFTHHRGVNPTASAGASAGFLLPLPRMQIEFLKHSPPPCLELCRVAILPLTQEKFCLALSLAAVQWVSEMALEVP